MENASTTETLFDLEQFAGPEKERKKPKSQAEKELRRIEEMEQRELKNLEKKLNSGKTLTAAEANRLEGYRKRHGFISGAELPEGIVRTMHEVAGHFGKHVQTIKNWAKKGMPRGPDTYDLKKIKQWVLNEGLIEIGSVTEKDDNGSDGRNDRKEKIGLSKSYFETLLKKTDSELKQLKLEIARGEYYRKDEVIKGWRERIGEFIKALDYLENSLPPLLEGLTREEMQKIIRNETWKMRDNCFRTGKFCPEVN